MEESRELERQAKKGKKEAFAKLYETVYEDMYRFALYVLKDREDAEDAVAETVADAFESIGKLRKEEAFRAWIFQILSNKCKRKLKEYITKTYSYEENEQRLENKIVDVMEQCQQEIDDPNQSLRNFARELAKAIIEELKEADVVGVCPTNGGILTEGKIQ